MTNRLFRIISVGWLLAGGAVYAQAPARAFDVASIKSAPPLNPAAIAAGKIHIGMRVDGSQVDIGFMSLADLIRVAYNVKAFQITGPDWMSQQRFDVLAKMPEGATSDQVPAMLQTLLAERFKLEVRKESKEHSIYALVVGKNGPKLKESPPDEAATAVPPAGAPPTNAAPPPPPPPGNSTDFSFGAGNQKMNIQRSGNGTVISGGPNGRMRVEMGQNGQMHMEISKMTMAQFADTLTPFVDRPVVDMTELKGNYQVSLDLAMEELLTMARAAGLGVPGMAPPGGGQPGQQQPAAAASDPSGSSIFATVQQLGLKLDARKAPMDMIVVVHLEKAPTEN
ncbi:MAG: TIGR03435 family protein [Acidobacteriia bacterium]|nr:TIGR03435 family protein [Terriglobia bacterium]